MPRWQAGPSFRTRIRRASRSQSARSSTTVSYTHLDVYKRQTHEGLSPNDILSIIREAGIVGMGGATFPTDIKAVTAQGRVDTILVNACECEPYITADDALLCSYPEQIFRGDVYKRQPAPCGGVFFVYTLTNIKVLSMSC